MFKEVKNIEACIMAAERNIEYYEALDKAKELKLEINDAAANPCTIYVSGECNRGILEVLKQTNKGLLIKI